MAYIPLLVLFASATTCDDMITSISGQPATGHIQLQGLTLTEKPGNTVSIDHTRDGHLATPAMTPGAQP